MILIAIIESTLTLNDQMSSGILSIKTIVTGLQAAVDKLNSTAFSGFSGAAIGINNNLNHVHNTVNVVNQSLSQVNNTSNSITNNVKNINNTMNQVNNSTTNVNKNLKNVDASLDRKKPKVKEIKSDFQGWGNAIIVANQGLELAGKLIGRIRGEINETINTASENIRVNTMLGVVLASHVDSIEEAQFNYNRTRLLIDELADSSGMFSTSLSAGAAELATYFSDMEALEVVMRTLPDYAAGMTGQLEIGAQEMTNLATQLGKVTTGAFDGLTRKGFQLTEVQKEIIANGTEMEKALVIAEVIGENWGNLAETMAATPVGVISRMKNEMSSLRDVIGRVTLAFQAGLYNAIMRVMPSAQTMAYRINDALYWIGNNVEAVQRAFLVLGSVMTFVGIRAILPFAPAIITAGLFVVAISEVIKWLNDMGHSNEEILAEVIYWFLEAKNTVQLFADSAIDVYNKINEHTDNLIPKIMAVAGAFGLVNTVMRKNPILGVTGLVIGLVTWVNTLGEDTDTMATKFGLAWEIIKDKINGFASEIEKQMPEIMTFIENDLPGILTNIANKVAEYVPIIVGAGIELFGSLAKGTKEIIDAIIPWIKPIIEGIGKKWEESGIADSLRAAGRELFSVLFDDKDGIIGKLELPTLGIIAAIAGTALLLAPFKTGLIVAAGVLLFGSMASDKDGILGELNVPIEALVLGIGGLLLGKKFLLIPLVAEFLSSVISSSINRVAGIEEGSTAGTAIEQFTGAVVGTSAAAIIFKKLFPAAVPKAASLISGVAPYAGFAALGVTAFNLGGYLGELLAVKHLNDRAEAIEREWEALEREWLAQTPIVIPGFDITQYLTSGMVTTSSNGLQVERIFSEINARAEELNIFDQSLVRNIIQAAESFGFNVGDAYVDSMLPRLRLLAGQFYNLTVEDIRHILGIQSLSREFAYMGEMSGMGYVLRLEDILKTVPDMFNYMLSNIMDVLDIQSPSGEFEYMADMSGTAFIDTLDEYISVVPDMFDDMLDNVQNVLSNRELSMDISSNIMDVIKQFAEDLREFTLIDASALGVGTFGSQFQFSPSGALITSGEYDIKGENLRMIVDLATRQYAHEYRQSGVSPVINNNINNPQINSVADYDRICDKLMRECMGALDATAAN